MLSQCITKDTSTDEPRIYPISKNKTKDGEAKMGYKWFFVISARTCSAQKGSRNRSLSYTGKFYDLKNQ